MPVKTAPEQDKPTRRIPGPQRRAQLLETARAMILKDGAGALTMSALADAVGVTKPIVYKHFENSDAIAIALLKEYVEGSVRAAVEQVRDAATIFEFLDGIVDSLFDHVHAQGAIERSITNGFSSSLRVDGFFLRQRERTHSVYRDLLEQQGVPEKQAALAAYALMEMINITVLEYAGRNDPADRETLKQLVRGTVGAVVKGPGVRPRIPAIAFLMPGEEEQE